MYLLDSLEKNGFKYTIKCIHYLKKQFKDVLSEKNNKIQTLFSEEETPLGAGEAIKKALNLVRSSKQIEVHNGDSFKTSIIEKYLNHIKKVKKI